ncbi:MAG TPA: hypothetical protein VGG23_03950 [Acidimicrobiales bacterium]
MPISSWGDLDRLQIMISTLPTVEQKPDIYLDGMYAEVSYDRTLAEALSDTLADAADALDSVIDPDATPAAPKPPAAVTPAAPPPPLVITTKEMTVSLDGPATARPGSRPVAVAPSGDGMSLTVSGTCSRKYFVILVYRNPSDYRDAPSSFVANQAEECPGGTFSYDTSSLSPDIRSGDYYLLTADEDDTGPWSPASDIYPITVFSTTTTETVPQD